MSTCLQNNFPNNMYGKEYEQHLYSLRLYSCKFEFVVYKTVMQVELQLL
jgi:hypothetical protein